VVGRFVCWATSGPIVHAVTTRWGLDPHFVAQRRDEAAVRVAQGLGLGGAAFCEQVHAATVVSVDAAGGAGAADAMVTDKRSLALVGFSADCPLILLFDPDRPAVGIAHASWRGTVGLIAAATVGRMCELFGSRPGRMQAAIAPSAGPCCYEVGPDVLAAATDGIGSHAAGFFIERDGRLYFDLWRANVDQLARAGLKRDNVFVSGVCTICRGDLFASYRRQGPAAGRFAAMIALR